MKGKEEDDDGRTKSASESLQINHLVGLSARVKLEQMPDRARFQSNLVREGGTFDGVLLSYNFQLFYIRSFRAYSLVVLLLLCTISHDFNEYEVE